MRHYVIIRLAVHDPGFGEKSQVYLDDAWIERRLALLEQICLPSLNVQTCQSFERVICLDIHANHRWFWRCRDLGFTTLGTSTFDHRRTICDFLEKTAERNFLTTRLDSDDALHCDYIERVQEAANRLGWEDLETDHVFHYPCGYYLNVITRELKRVVQHCNPFLTLMEAGKDRPRSVYFDWHERVLKDTSVTPKMLGHEPKWLVGIHGDNVITQDRGNLAKLDLSELQRDFGVVLPPEPVIEAETESDQNGSTETLP